MKLKPKSKRFVRLIQKAGWSQAEAARRLDITPGAVSQICTGRTQPGSATLNLLQLLMRRSDPEPELHSTQTGSLIPWEMEMLNELRRVPHQKRESLLTAFRLLIHALQESK